MTDLTPTSHELVIAPYANAPLNCLDTSYQRVIPANIFENVTSKLPFRTLQVSVTKLAQSMSRKIAYVERKEEAKLITFNTYTEGANSRGNGDIKLAHAICGDWDKNFDAAIFENGLQELEYSGAEVIAYQTFSHTPDAPRWRIFVFLDEPITPNDYRTCWAGLNSIFGDRLDPNAKDCARLNYLPSCPIGQTREFRTLNIGMV